ncbi:exopolysaccharide biosynthesis polyprenyl glycosylphosphotransferase [Panacibacter sp. DH6]|uniref:Exopolysaccharide biosynthesis polyprenyl glycosylphosphotransferase n=1 Tax=Panacibacter microcysteis TaxID=2793269 RepID=A0A931E801_9BACT|nr:exopolysaccharide biosynthesis polyprenyl glycosylphosphotransferase [Panacibacter microcysteis]MBG9377061.1 exopolysaccharide biosynthesis polyprenyl glycosylphosphotransferase [Panacibacter microcysteis]
MKKHINLQHFVLLNIILCVIYFLFPGTFTAALLAYCMAVAGLTGIWFILYTRYIKEQANRPGLLMLGRRKTLLFAYSGFNLIMAVLFVFGETTMPVCLGFTVASGILLICLLRFDQTLTAFLYRTLNVSNRVAIVGSGDLSKELGNYIAQQHKFSFQGYLERDERQAIETSEQYIAFAAANNIRELYIPSGHFAYADIAMLNEAANKHCIRLKLIADTPLANIESFRYTEHFNKVLLLKAYNEPLSSLKNRIAKRLFDCIISSVVMITILWWLIPLIGILIKAESKGPVFFKQLRSGRNNQSFWCYKFRTMVNNADSDQKQATRDDARVTKIGAFLRRTSLDELPQFINVLKNEMSIIGPRPHMLRHTEEYSNLIKAYMVRLYLKPGLTGWAQVNGFRGETPDLESMQKRIEHDIWYMQNWSPRLDTRIFFKTAINMLRKEENAF